MSRFRFICLLILWLLPLLGQAQDDTDVALEEYVEKLNDMCPIDYGGEWGFNSFTMVGNSYALVDMKLPANLSMFLSSFGSNEDNVKRMWINQLSQYGDQWNHLIDLIKDTGKRLILNLHPVGSSKTALITLLPTDFKK